MRKLVAISAAIGLLLAFVVAAPVAAGTRTDVTMTVTTTFDDFPDEFVATGLPDCEWGLVYTEGAMAQFTRTRGVFSGYKVFACEGGEENGFVVRLSARFGESGSIGTWAVVASWGTLAGLSGAGKLSGDPIDGGIIDTYVGTVTL